MEGEKESILNPLGDGKTGNVLHRLRFITFPIFLAKTFFFLFFLSYRRVTWNNFFLTEKNIYHTHTSPTRTTETSQCSSHSLNWYGKFLHINRLAADIWLSQGTFWIYGVEFWHISFIIASLFHLLGNLKIISKVFKKVVCSWQRNTANNRELYF